MTGDPRERFTDEEWAFLTDAPMVAGMLVATAGRLGNVRAIFAVIGEYAATRERLPGPLLAAILDRPRPDVRARVGRRKTLPQKGPPVLRAGIDLLARKASDDEREEYTRFVLALAEAAARVGGDQRQAALRNVAAILSAGGSASGRLV
jgi:hypothetical protein